MAWSIDFLTASARCFTNGSTSIPAGYTGSTTTLSLIHISGTGYKVDLERLQFLSADIRRDIAVVQSAPVLSANFESSVSGLYFVGLSAANTFGPVMRFAFGAGFAARRVSGALMRTASRNTVPVAAAETVVPARTERTTTR